MPDIRMYRREVDAYINDRDWTARLMIVVALACVAMNLYCGIVMMDGFFRYLNVVIAGWNARNAIKLSWYAYQKTKYRRELTDFDIQHGCIDVIPERREN